jgi:hypothetical protein
LNLALTIAVPTAAAPSPNEQALQFIRENTKMDEQFNTSSNSLPRIVTPANGRTSTSTTLKDQIGKCFVENHKLR